MRASRFDSLFPPFLLMRRPGLRREAEPRPDRRRRGVLVLPQLAIARAGGEELGVRAEAHHLALVEDEEGVGMAHRGEAMGNDERGPALAQVPERGADLGLG